MGNTGKSGGFRPGAGRPTGSGKFREKTSPIRIPLKLVSKVREILEVYAVNPNAIFSNNLEDAYQLSDPNPGLPFYSSSVAAGFPSPADDFLESKLDLNQYLIKHPAATFYVRVKGDSMIGAGIHEDDVLIVDRSLKPTNHKVIIAVINGELTVKRLNMSGGKISLVAENEKYPPILINEEMEFSIWGVVTNVIHSL